MEKFIDGKKCKNQNFIYQNFENQGGAYEVVVEEGTGNDPYPEVTRLSVREAVAILKDHEKLAAFIKSAEDAQRKREKPENGLDALKISIASTPRVRKLLEKIANNPKALKEVADARLDPKNVSLRSPDPSLFWGVLDYDLLDSIRDNPYKAEKAKALIAKLSTADYAHKIADALTKIPGLKSNDKVDWEKISDHHSMPKELNIIDLIIRTVKDKSTDPKNAIPAGHVLNDLSNAVQNIKAPDGVSQQVKDVIEGQKTALFERIFDQRHWVLTPSHGRKIVNTPGTT